MTKDELIDFISSNLTVDVSVNTTYGYYNDQSTSVKVTLLLDDKIISEAVDYIS